MQRYNADGSEYGIPFVFEDLDQINEALPLLETLSDGRVVVNWTLRTYESGGDNGLKTSSVAQQVVALPREGTEGNDIHAADLAALGLQIEDVFLLS